MHRLEDQLDADEAEDDRQAVLEVDEAVEQAVDEEEELAQTHQRERRRGEHDVDVVGDAVDGGDGVERKQDVGAADGDHHEQHRGEDAAAVLDREQLVAVVVVGGAKEALGEPDDEVVCLVVALLLGGEEAACGDDQDQAEHVEGPREVVDDRHAEEDERGAGEQREDDAEQQHLLLVRAGHGEARHDHDEHEEVVDGEGLLEDVALEVVDAHAVAADDPQHDAEDDREADVDGRPDRRLTQRRFVRLAHVEEEVEREKATDHQDGDEPHVQ